MAGGSESLQTKDLSFAVAISENSVSSFCHFRGGMYFTLKICVFFKWVVQPPTSFAKFSNGKCPSQITSPKTKMTMEQKQPFEDVFPIKTDDHHFDPNKPTKPTGSGLALGTTGEGHQ